MKKTRLVVSIILLVAVIPCWWAYQAFFKEGGIHIALVGPMTGENENVGRSFKQGVRLYIEEINEKGGINGKEIVLDVYDDQNKQNIARAKAIEIRRENRAVAVIGHHYSSCSIAAGEIYKSYGIPAISPASTNVKVTKENEWYFRSTFNDRLQGRFLATYAKKVLGYDTVSIIRDYDEYGAYLASVFEERVKDLDVKIKYRWAFEVGSKFLKKDLEHIVNELQYKKDAGIIFLATHAPEGIRLVKRMRDLLIKNPIMAPDAFASEAFQYAFNDYPKEKSSPGYYTDGIYVTTPWTSDITNEKGLKFQEAYKARYKEEAGWHAAFAHDTAVVAIEGIRKSGVQGGRDTVRADRKRLREWLANLTSMYEAVEGVTGYNYFDEQGDSQKPIYVATYKHQRLISALTQFRTVPNINEVPNFDQAVKEGRIIKFDGKHSYKTNVVYTGIEINEISELDVGTFTYMLDFYLWFRFQGNIKVHEMEFLNAVDPISLSKSLAQEKPDYRLFHVKARFQADFLPNLHIFGRHILGVSFRPRAMDRNNLIMVKDVLGMRLSNDAALVEKMNRSKILNPMGVRGSLGRVETTSEGGQESKVLTEMKHGWKISEVLFFQNIAEKSLLGDPEFFNVRGGILEYSQFNLGIQIVEDELSLRRSIPVSYAVWLLIFSAMGTLLLRSLIKGKSKKGGQKPEADGQGSIPQKKIFGIFPDLTPQAKPLWFVQIGFAVLVLITAEVLVLYMLSQRLTMSLFENIVITFDIFWWLATAFFLTMGAERFAYTPAEERTGQPIPQIVRVIISLVIYILAVMAIIGFVFDQRLTSLLATGGVLAMIIGLAVQVNISNIFSGIAMNLERPFKIDDWVKIGGFTEGKVMDISWRTTRLKTRDDTVLCIPNSQASESPIENFSHNDNKGYWKYFTIHVDPTHSPERVKKVLKDAALSAEGVITDDPKHPIGTRFLGLTRGMTGQSESWAANYLIGVYVADYGMKFAHNEAIWDSVWTHLKHAGIRHVMERQEVQLWFQGMKKTKGKLSKTRALLEDQDIFKPFSDEEKSELSKRMRNWYFRPAQTVVQQGDSGDSMFLIAEGSLSIKVSKNGNEFEVARLGTGDIFGEMALLTGEKRMASVISLTDTHLYEITKADIDPVFRNRPEVSEPLSEVLGKRKMATAAKMSSQEPSAEEEKNLAEQIFEGMKKFFGF